MPGSPEAIHPNLILFPSAWLTYNECFTFRLLYVPVWASVMAKVRLQYFVPGEGLSSYVQFFSIIAAHTHSIVKL